LLVFDCVGTASLECNYRWTTEVKGYDLRGTPTLYGQIKTANYVSRCRQKCINNPSCTGIDYKSEKFASTHMLLMSTDPWCWIVVPESRHRKTKKTELVNSDIIRNCPKAITGIICHGIMHRKP